MTTRSCPLCHRSFARTWDGQMLSKLERIRDQWMVVADGASRYYMHKLKKRYPGWEFRHYKIDMWGELYRIEARRYHPEPKPKEKRNV